MKGRKYYECPFKRVSQIFNIYSKMSTYYLPNSHSLRLFPQEFKNQSIKNRYNTKSNFTYSSPASSIKLRDALRARAFLGQVRQTLD